MTVSTTVRKAGPYVGNATASDFPFSFRVFEASDVMVVVADADGVEATWVLDVDYEVDLNADQDGNPGGTIHTLSPLPTLFRLIATTAIEETQDVVITNAGGFYPEVFNDVFDKQTILIQQVSQEARRALSAAITDDDASLTMPTAVARAGGTLAFDDDGVPIVGPAPGDLNDAIADAEAARDAAVASAAAAASARDATLAAFDSFDDRYLGVKSADPTLDNDGNALVAGSLYFNSTAGEMRIWTGSAWVAAYVSGGSYAAQSTTISGGGLVTGGGSLAADRTLTVDAASGAELLAAASSAKALTPDAVGDSREPNVANAGGSTTLSLAATCVHWLTATGNITLNALTASGVRKGQPFVIRITQDATGSRTLAVNAAFKFPNGLVPTLSTAAGAVDEISGYIVDPATGLCSCRFAKGVA